MEDAQEGIVNKGHLREVFIAQQTQRCTNTKSELLREKKELIEIYLDFRRRYKNVDPMESHNDGPISNITISIAFRFRTLIDIEMRLASLPAGSRTFFDEVNQRYIDEHNERLVFMRNTHTNEEMIDLGVMTESLTGFHITGMRLDSMLRRSIQTIGNLLINTSTANGTSPIEQLPTDIWKHLLALITEDETWSTLHAISVIPLLSKTIMRRCGIKEVTFIRAEIDDIADRCLFNYVCNMSVSFTPVFHFMKEDQYSAFEKSEVDLVGAFTSGDRYSIYTAQRKSLRSDGSLTIPSQNFDMTRIPITLMSGSRSSKELRDVISDLGHGISSIDCAVKSKWGGNDTDTFGESRQLIYCNCKVMYVLVKNLVHMKPPPGYVLVFELAHHHADYRYFREKSHALKCIQVEGYENEPIKNMLLCTDVDDGVQRTIRASITRGTEYNQIHLLTRLTDLRRIIAQEISKVIYHRKHLSGFLEGNVRLTDYGLSLISHSEHLLFASRFYTFTKKPGYRYIDWKHFLIPMDYTIVPREDARKGIMHYVTSVIQKIEEGSIAIVSPKVVIFPQQNKGN